MSELNANLETSKPNNQSNSQTDNSDTSGAGKKPAKEVTKDTQQERPRSLEELFGDPSDESNLEINLDDDTPDDPNAPIDSIDRLMKRQKLTAEQAYAIKIPMPNGAEALTIGQLKDKISELTDLDIRVLQFDERRIKQEGELLRSQAEIRDLVATLPKDALKPEVLQKLRERRAQTEREQRLLTLEHIPEWRDEKKRTQELEGIVEMFSDYGFDESFLDTIKDHRAMKFVRDMFLMRSRIKKALAEVRDPKKLGVRPSGKPAKPAIKPNAVEPRRKAVQTQDDKLRNWFSSKE